MNHVSQLWNKMYCGCQWLNKDKYLQLTLFSQFYFLHKLSCVSILQTVMEPLNAFLKQNMQLEKKLEWFENDYFKEYIRMKVIQLAASTKWGTWQIFNTVGKIQASRIYHFPFSYSQYKCTLRCLLLLPIFTAEENFRF